MSWSSKGDAERVDHSVDTPQGQAKREGARMRDIQALSKADAWVVITFTDGEGTRFSGKTSAWLQERHTEAVVIEACKAVGATYLAPDSDVTI